MEENQKPLSQMSTYSDLPVDMFELLKAEVCKIIEGNELKKIIVFGAGARGILFAEILRFYNLSVEYFLETNQDKLNKTTCEKMVYPPEILLNEKLENILLVIAATYPATILEEISKFGLKDKIEMRFFFDRWRLDSGTPRVGKMKMLDYFVGYNRLGEFPGFEIMGDEKFSLNKEKEELRIIVLGGSNTDPEVMDPIEYEENPDKYRGSWPLHLHENLIKNNIKHVMINGALGAFTSSQELLKLLRDCLTFKADIIIVYDGINDACSDYWYEGKYPLIHSFLHSNVKSYFESINSGIKPPSWNHVSSVDSNAFNEYVDGIFNGFPVELSSWQVWLNNLRMMKAICSEFGIVFTAFLQPPGYYLPDYYNSCEIKYRTSWILHNFINSWGSIINQHGIAKKTNSLTEEVIKNYFDEFLRCSIDKSLDAKQYFKVRSELISDFYENARILLKDYEYIFDVSDIFNGYPDILFDNCHCTNFGNKLIGKRIFHELSNYKEWKNLIANKNLSETI